MNEETVVDAEMVPPPASEESMQRAYEERRFKDMEAALRKEFEEERKNRDAQERARQQAADSQWQTLMMCLVCLLFK